MSHSPIVSAGVTVADRFRIEAGAPDGSFRATDARTGREVVLRVIAGEARASAEAAARVSHPNLADVLETGTDDVLGAAWVAWEAMEGEPLAALLARRGTPPPALALRIVQEAAAGIAAGHRVGVVHGEVHPDTIFLARDDRRVRVLGLGARAGISMRSPAARYASPEVLRRAEPGPESDVFSLGVVAYELLAGLPPRWGATLAAMARGQAPELPPLPAGVPRPVAAAVLRALDAAPARRWPDAGSFAAALAPTRIAAPGWTIAPVQVPARAPRFLLESKTSRPGYLAGVIATLFIVLALGWIATH